jgi:hypothetical protein
MLVEPPLAQQVVPEQYWLPSSMQEMQSPLYSERVTDPLTLKKN